MNSCHSLVCWCFGADADSQPFPPFFFSSRRVGVCEEGRVVTRPPFFFCDRLVLYRFIEIEPRHFFFSLFAPFFFLSRRVFGLRRHWPPLQFAKFLFVCLFFPLRTWQPFLFCCRSWDPLLIVFYFLSLVHLAFEKGGFTYNGRERDVC